MAYGNGYQQPYGQPPQGQYPQPHQYQQNPQAQGQAPNAAYGQAPGMPYGQPQSAPTGGGLMKQALSDITSSKGWILQVIIQGLLMCIPILNFGIYGNAMRFGYDAASGKQSGPEGGIPKVGNLGKNFVGGFFSLFGQFLIGLVAAIACLLLCLILIGFLLSPIISIVLAFAMPFLAISSFMYGIGGAFKIKQMMTVMKRRTGTFLFCSFVPNLIVGIIATIIITIIAMIFTAGASTQMNQLTYAIEAVKSGTMSVSQLSAMISSIFGSMSFILSIIASFFTFLGALLTSRTVGLFIASYAPDFANASMPGCGQLKPYIFNAGEAYSQPYQQPAYGQQAPYQQPYGTPYGQGQPSPYQQAQPSSYQQPQYQEQQQPQYQQQPYQQQPQYQQQQQPQPQQPQQGSSAYRP